ncbi:hypothetical protein [Burkholderia glumae]|uniref:hypothetical protein n=1 Tax=Burkholderia glumae TaxID=337 RepID=UPI0020374888|nr:hypothetical protein [Burkholderia glumae]MCM2550462.1 hypothetical protein [Burkholderia glumae]
MKQQVDFLDFGLDVFHAGKEVNAICVRQSVGNESCNGIIEDHQPLSCRNQDTAKGGPAGNVKRLDIGSKVPEVFSPCRSNARRTS